MRVYRNHAVQDPVNEIMEAILKVISCLLAVYIIANGVWVIRMPPSGDEPLGYLIIAAGIFLPLLTFCVARLNAGLSD